MKRTHITLHEFTARRDLEDFDRVIVEPHPLLLKVSDIEEARPVSVLDREDAYRLPSGDGRGGTSQPLPEEYRTTLLRKGFSTRTFVTETVEDVQALIDGADPNEPVECREKRCSYFDHYLAYGPADLTHEGYHAAERKCAEVQERARQWYDAHPEGQLPKALDDLCQRAEERIRA